MAASEVNLKGHLNTCTLMPVLNAGWELTGLNLKVLLEPLLPSTAAQFVVDGIRIQQSALLPDFPGAAPRGYEHTYGQAQPLAQPQAQPQSQAQLQAQPQTQPQAKQASAQLQAADMPAATGSSIQAHGQQPQDAEQALDPELQNLMLVVMATALKLPKKKLERRVRSLR
jgi:hypothetical protein